MDICLDIRTNLYSSILQKTVEATFRPFFLLQKKYHAQLLTFFAIMNHLLFKDPHLFLDFWSLETFCPNNFLAKIGTYFSTNWGYKNPNLFTHYLNLNNSIQYYQTALFLEHFYIAYQIFCVTWRHNCNSCPKPICHNFLQGKGFRHILNICRTGISLVSFPFVAHGRTYILP